MRKFLKWVFILIVVVGVGGYFGIPALLGTGFAHEQVRQAMADGTGREVELGQISFGWMSGLTVSNVTVKQKAGDFAEEGPLFTLEGLSLDLGWKQILNKKIEVSDLTVDGPSIVIIRDKNGRFNFDDLLEKSAEEKPDTPSGTAPPVTVHLFINDGRVLFIDQKVGTRVEMEDFDARAEWKEGKLVLSADFILNDGEVNLLANADLSKQPSPFEVEQVVIDGSQFTANAAVLAPFIPLMGEKPQNASGTLGFKLEGLKAEGLDMDSLKRSLTGAGSLSLEGGAMLSGPITQLFSALKALGAKDLSALSGGSGSQALDFNLLSSTFAIRDGRIFTDDLKLEGVGMNLGMKGSTGLDGTVDYTLLVGGLDDLIGKNKALSKYVGNSGAIPFGFKGSLASPKISVDAEGALKGAAESLIDEHLPGGLKGILPGGK
jgi:AsmA family